MASERFVTLRGATADVIVDVAAGVPAIVHWGAPHPDAADSIPVALDRPIAHGGLDVVAPISIVPEHGSAFAGRPGLLGHRARGRSWAPRFAPAGHRIESGTLVVVARDRVAELTLITRIALADVLTVSVEIVNDGASRYLLDGLTVTLPLPEHGDGIGSFTGRWTRELHPVRRPWPHGAISVENRRGRTSH